MSLVRTAIAVQHGVKKLALLTGCLFLLACSSDGDRAGGGGQGGHAGSQGGSGGAGNSGGGGTTGGGGQIGGNTGGGGNAGRGGAGGQGGKAGQGGTSGQSCSELQSAYGKALMQAKMCNAAIDRVQCTQLVSSPLICCPTYVDDRTELDKIYAQWQAAGCTPNIACPAIVCPVPARGGCVTMDSGDWCRDLPTP